MALPESHEPDSHSDTTKLPATYGQGTSAFVVIASMVGTGVLVTSGYSIYSVGSNLLVLGLWVAGGILAYCGALTLAELATRLPKSGGDYVYLHEAYGPLPAFLSGWVSFLIGFGGPIATSSLAAARYLLQPLGYTAEDPIVLIVATLAILVFAVIHTLGARTSSGAQGVTTVVKLVILTLLGVVGIAVAPLGNWQHLADPKPVDRNTLISMGISLVYIYYAFTGWNGVGYIAGEVRDPQRKLPWAIAWGVGLVTLLYLVLNVMFMLALSAEDINQIVISATSDPSQPQVSAVEPIAALAATELFGSRIGNPLSVAIGLTMLSSLSAFVLTGSRVAYAMARAGQFPQLAAKILAKRGTPAVAIAAQAGWSILLVWGIRALDDLLLYSAVGLVIFSSMTISSVYVLRRRKDLPLTFRTPGYPVTPAIYLVGTGALTIAAFLQRWVPSTLALLSIAAGVPAYWVWTRVQRRSASQVDPGQSREHDPYESDSA